MKVVLDTNVLVTALKSRQGASYKLLSMLGEGHYSIVLSVPVVLEYEEVLKRLFPQFGEKVIEGFIDYLCAIGKTTEIFYIWRPQLKDPDDEMLLELAVAANANYIISYNKVDLTSSDKFGIQVATPKEFLQLLGVIP